MDEIPTLPQLMRFGVHHVDIVQEISGEYSYCKFGILLLEDDTGDKMEAIEIEKHGDVEAINLAVLRMWMIGEGRKPANWATLATVLEECGFAALAHEICYIMTMPGTS